MMKDANQYQMLYDIQILDFVLYDLTLFLDTHPRDKKALEYYNHFLPMKNRLMKDFSAMYYPLCLNHAESGNHFRWEEAPLPWEGGC